MRAFFLIFLFFIVHQSTFSQGKGFLGKRVKLEISHAPSLYANRILGSLFSESMAFNVYSSPKYFNREIRLETFLSRKSTFGITYKKSNFLFANKRYRTNPILGEEAFLSSISAFQVQISRYSGLAPLQRYFLFGFGLNQIDLNPKNSGFELPEVDQTKYTVPYFSLELGGNSFLTEVLYLTAGIESSIVLSLEPFSLEPTFKNLNFDRFWFSRILEFKFGVGISI